MTLGNFTDEAPRDHTQAQRRIVVTGGPGAGKTAVLELIRVSACSHVQVLPEAASILFGGGFPRRAGVPERRASQRAIYHVQRELEAVGEASGAAVVLCDRGTPDALAYWPGDPEDFWRAVHSSLAAELGRYSAVIHLRTPEAQWGYNHANPVRTETAAVAAEIDARVGELWATHPRVFTIPASHDFLVKANAALDVIRAELPACCREHVSAPRAS